MVTMAENKHTSGPWHYIRGENNPNDKDSAESGFTIVLQSAPLGSVYESHKELRYCDSLYPEDGAQHAEAEANARIMSTSPELLAEVEEWHNYLFESGHHERAEQVLKVISKARGETN